MSGRLLVGQLWSNRLRSEQIAKLFLIGLFLLTASGCAQITESVKNDKIYAKNALVARDLLYVISQIYPPGSTTIQLGEPNSEFGHELVKGFREMGYGLQRMSADQGPRFLSYTELSRSTTPNGGTATYSLFVGDVGLERIYAIAKGGGIAPLGPITVYGTEKQVVLSEQLFPGQSLDVRYAESTKPDIDPNAITIIEEGVMAAISDLQSQYLPSYRTLNSQNQVIENLFHLGSSNFSQVDREFRVVHKTIVVFPNDSLWLLEKGREQIDKLVSFYRPGADVIRLVGCSHGPTLVDGGNERLALGRSKRIAQELVSRRVNEQDILDEGCWAVESTEGWPPRGVVVELQRRNS